MSKGDGDTSEETGDQGKIHECLGMMGYDTEKSKDCVVLFHGDQTKNIDTIRKNDLTSKGNILRTLICFNSRSDLGSRDMLCKC